jgi:broad specificity phosphatase PhoE
VVIDDRLTEWRLSALWAGIVWEELETVRPGELTAYLNDPADLPFSPETLADLGSRVAVAATEHAAAVDGDVVIVSHQDPIHAGTRTLTASGLDDFGVDKPAHATVVALRTDTMPWQAIARFDPAQGQLFPPAPSQ